MIEKAFHGGRAYWTWLAVLAAVICAGAWLWRLQFTSGLGITGLGRDVTWGLYIAQFTFLVGVAASAVMVVLPYYLHDRKAFAPVVALGEFLSIAAVVSSGLFIFVDMGRPDRVLNVLRYPSPGSMMFWDMLALGGYLALNVVITRAAMEAERSDVDPPRWIRVLVVVSIPWAISIHTVTAFLYNGLPGRSFWLTAVLAPRFLASAFAAGPALLILGCLAARRLRVLDVGREAIAKVGVIVAYAMVVHVFLLLLELFTVLYSQVPEHVEHVRYLYVGIDGHRGLVPWMWTSAALAAVALVLLLVPGLRRREPVLAAACLATFLSLWIDKGMGLVVGGFVPTPLGRVLDYAPTLPEMGIAAAIWAVGLLLVTVFFHLRSKIISGTFASDGAQKLRI
jgi:molybdopterin-containing oxidoreductase family membrane subunit